MTDAKMIVHDLGIGKLREEIAKLKSSRFTVGWQGESGAEHHDMESDATNIEIATWHEFGTRSMPARPVVRTTYERHAEEFREAFKAQLSALIDARTDVDAMIDVVGRTLVEALRDEIDLAAEWAAPLAQSTIDAKGHNQPLVDTGTLRRRASWAMRAKDGDAIIKQGGEQ